MTISVRNPSQRSQRGVAAIEFALVFSTLLLFLYGIATFGSVFYTQQAVSRAAEDGARALTAINGPVNGDAITAVKSVIYDSLSTSLVGPSNATQAQRKTWLQSNLTVNVDATGLVRVTYPYDRSRLLNLSESWVPTTIVGRAQIAL
ncbi:hypothetical protein BH10PSE18_BH10PSE18_20720 [soil metagenome]